MSVFSDVKLFVNNGTSTKVVARGSVLISNVVRVNFTVLNGITGRFVMLPSEKSDKIDEVTKKPRYFPHAQLISRELADELNRVVLSEIDGAKSPAAEKTKKTGKGLDDGVPF